MVEILLACSSPGCVHLLKIKDGQSLTLMAQIPAQHTPSLWPVLDLSLSKSQLEKDGLGGCAQLCVCVVSPPPVPRTCLVRGVEKMLNVPTAAAALSAGCSLVTKREARVPVLKHLPWRALTVKEVYCKRACSGEGQFPWGKCCSAQSLLPSPLQAICLLPLPTCSFDTQS